MRLARLVVVPAILALTGGAGPAPVRTDGSIVVAQPADKPTRSDPAYVLGRTMKRIDGSPQNLEEYKGKVVVIVNVASQCGFTGQYEGLEKLYQEKKDAGLVVLGFPSNSFNQEKGTNGEIAEFCKGRYKVTFPLFEKISVKGDEQDELYKLLAARPDPVGGDPKWNFTKFVVDREGRVVARFDADRKYVRTAELEPDLLKKIDELLAAGGAESPPTIAGD